MAADKLGKVELFEQTLRKLIQLVPDHAQAYNALGYSLLERNIRLEEGMQLVEKAYQLTPDDAAITDSMGWDIFGWATWIRAQRFCVRLSPSIPIPKLPVIWARFYGCRETSKRPKRFCATP